MPRVTPLLVTLAALLATLPSGTALSCYKCDDRIDTDSNMYDSLGVELTEKLDKLLKSLHPCSEFRSNEARFREDCPPGNSCGKMVMPDGRTTRSCVRYTMEDHCKEVHGATGCLCSTDYCNAAGRGAPALPLLLLLPAASLILLNGQL